MSQKKLCEIDDKITELSIEIEKLNEKRKEIVRMMIIYGTWYEDEEQ